MGNLPMPWEPLRGVEDLERKETVGRIIEWFWRTWPETRGVSFEKVFPEEARPHLSRVILPPVFLATKKCLRPLFADHLRELTESLNELEDFVIHPDRTSYVVHAAVSLDDLDLYTKAVTFFYALSTHLVPYVVEMGELLSLLSDFRSGTYESFADLSASWFLVVLYPFSQHRMLRSMEGDLISFFERRRRGGRFTLFADLSDDAELTGEDLRFRVSKNPGLGRLGRFLSDKTVLYTT